MSLTTRAMNMLKSPKTEWDAIASEDATSNGLITGYAVPLSLLATIGGFIASAYMSAAITGMFGVDLHFGMGYWLAIAVMGFVLGLVTLYVAAWIVNWLAPKFGSTSSDINAMKLVVYSMTGNWVGKIVSFVPVIGWLASIVGGIYSIYLFYLGLPKLMGTPQDKVVAYMIVSALAMFVVMAVVGAIVGSIATAMFVSTAISIGS